MKAFLAIIALLTALLTLLAAYLQYETVRLQAPAVPPPQEQETTRVEGGRIISGVDL